MRSPHRIIYCIVLCVASHFYLLKNSQILSQLLESGNNRLLAQHEWNVTLTILTNQDSTRNKNAKRYLGFVRIPKTGSTSMMRVINEAFPRTHNLFRFYREETSLEDPFQESKCFFGFGEKSSLPKHRGAIDTITDGCPHRQLKSLERHYNTVVPLLHSRHRATVDEIGMFTIIREPWDRMNSLFHYARQIYPKWKDSFTHEQNQCILTKNLTCFVHQLHTQGGARVVGATAQYKLLDSNFDRAIKLITPSASSPARVLILINECFDASLHLLADSLPQIFTSSLKGNRTMQSRRARKALRRYLSSHSTRINTGRHRKSSNLTDLESLQEDARRWFSKDFYFYKAAVWQFQDYLRKSNVDESLVQACQKALSKHMN